MIMSQGATGAIGAALIKEAIGVGKSPKHKRGPGGRDRAFNKQQ